MINFQQVRQHQLSKQKKDAPGRGAQILVMGFAAIILVGTALLKLPFATEPGHGVTWLDALFTATSAVTVTGLIVVPTSDTYSLFGEIVILGLIQVGGIGFITLSVLLFRLIGRRVSIYERNLLQQTLGVEGRGGIVNLTLVVIITTVAIELIGALLLFVRWVKVLDWPTALYFSIFHSISAFCNAGFDLFTSLEDPALLTLRSSPFMLVNMAILITIGTLGITVIYDVVAWPRERRLSLHTRLVLPFTLGLTVVGTIVLLLDEFFVDGHALSQFPPVQSFWVAFFTVVSARTAGLTLIPMDQLGQASQLLIFIWMFIGGAPASMGGGVGLSTVAVVLITLQSIVLGYSDVRVLRRTIPTETVFKAVAVLTVSTILVVLVTFLMLLIEEDTFFPVGFEVVSAFSNTGYSLGITGNLSWSSRLLIAFTMFWGRLGPLTLVVALAQRHRQTFVHYPEEKIIIG
ncbi:MAG: TrkH family potassium uptake protein [Anaerolineae bacterium]